VLGIVPKDVNQSVTTRQVQPDKMSSWTDSVLAAEAKKAGRTSEDTRLSLTPRPPSLTGKLAGIHCISETCVTQR